MENLIESTASFSPDRRHRFILLRFWAEGEKIMFIGLNPSTADENQDDPTVRRCMGFAKSWGYAGIYLCNLYALITKYPHVLHDTFDRIGMSNNLVLKEVRKRVQVAVAAWGEHGLWNDRGFEVAKMLEPLKCFGLTKAGAPKHPLYLRRDQGLVDYL